MVECVWALLRPAGQTGKGGVGIEVLLSYSKAAFSIGLSGLQKKTAHFFLGARRRAVAFAYSKWIPRFGTLGNTIGWAGRVSNAPLPLLQLLRPRSGSRKQFVAKTFRPGGTLEDYYKAKGGGDGSALRHLLQSLLSGIRVQKTVCQKTRFQHPFRTHCLAHTATVPFLRVPQKWDRGSVR